MGADSIAAALLLAENLREQCDGLKIVMHCGGGSVKSKMKKADKSGAVVALILGEQELADRTVTVKFLRQHAPQICLKQSDISRHIDEWLQTE